MKTIIEKLMHIHNVLDFEDSDIEVESDEEEMEYAPVQYAGRKIMELIQELEAEAGVRP